MDRELGRSLGLKTEMGFGESPVSQRLDYAGALESQRHGFRAVCSGAGPVH